MIERYDRLLLVLAGLLLCAGLGYPLLPGGEKPGADDAVPASAGGAPYAAVTAPVPAPGEAVWPRPVEQAPGWLYDVFTPPKIYLDPDTGAFVPTGWKIVPTEPFGVYLERISRRPYRIQLEGYVEEDRADASKNLLLLHDLESGESVRARTGQAVPQAGVEVIDFTVRRQRDADGNIAVVAEARLLDTRRGAEVRLRADEVLYEDGVEAVFRSREDPSVRIVVHRAGERFSTPQGRYRVEDIDLDGPGVTLIKEGDDRRQSVTRTLRPEQPPGHSPGGAAEPTMPIEPPAPLFDF